MKIEGISGLAFMGIFIGVLTVVFGLPFILVTGATTFISNNIWTILAVILVGMVIVMLFNFFGRLYKTTVGKALLVLLGVASVLALLYFGKQYYDKIVSFVG